MIPCFSANKGLGGVGLCFFSLLLFSSCITTQQDLVGLQEQIRTIDAEVNGIEKSMESTLSGSLDVKLRSIRENQAEAGDDIDKIRREIQDLVGRVEENAYLTRRTVERDISDQDRIKTGLADLNQRVAHLEADMRHLYEYLDLEPPVVSEKQDMEDAAPENSGTVLQTPSADQQTVSPERELYDSMLAMFRAEQYEEAIEGFRGFLNTYPKSDLADNAQFWIGECFMSLKQHEQALIAYQEVIKKYPKGNKVPNAMLRQAAAFLEMGEKDSAKILLRRIAKRYPETKEAQIAGKKIKTLDQANVNPQ